MARGDFCEKRGAAVITDSLTFVGSGGIDTVNAPIKHGATTLITHNLVTNAGLGNSVDGKVVMLNYFHTAAGTDTATPMHSRGATLTHWGPMPRAGSIVGIAAHITGALVGATDHITFAATVDGAASTVITLTCTATSVKYAQFAKDLVAFAAGKTIGMQYICYHLGTAKTMLGTLFVEI